MILVSAKAVPGNFIAHLMSLKVDQLAMESNYPLTRFWTLRPNFLAGNQLTVRNWLIGF